MDQFEESDRQELACDCGCGRRWVVSRGVMRHGDVIASFIAIPTSHDAGRVAWLAFGDGSEPSEWTCLRSWVDGTNVAAAVVDPAQSPIRRIEREQSLLPRERVIADARMKARVFALHDALLRAHPDLRQLVNPEHGRDFSRMMPDCVFALPSEQRSTRNNQNFAECGDRLFVRALLPIPVSDGGEVRVGVWIEVGPEPFFDLLRVFWDDEQAYLAMRLEGPIESSLAIAGNNVRGAHVTLAARNADTCLFIADSDVPWLAQLMREGVSARDLPDVLREMSSKS